MKTRMAGGALSPKAILAAVLPSLAGVIAVAVQWIATGEFDRAELATAISTVISALLAFLGAWAAEPGPVEAVPAETVTSRRRRRTHRASDDHGYADGGLLGVLLVICVVVLLVVLIGHLPLWLLLVIVLILLLGFVV